MKISLQPQECIGDSKFIGQIVCTKAFEDTFRDKTADVILVSMSLIFERVRKNIADYLQVLTAKTNTDTIKFWVIDDGSCVTFLLPQDY